MDKINWDFTLGYIIGIIIITLTAANLLNIDHKAWVVVFPAATTSSAVIFFLFLKKKWRKNNG